ncbi:hypothetical protein [Aliikangiella sp. IMCC44359]|uniref:hypothetical protein n=1 Tax=Aliikangiella sp. IMCC44359 TaxID=3459125 RepID=UPI00403AF700
MIKIKLYPLYICSFSAYFLLMLILTISSVEASSIQTTVEEQRIPKALLIIPKVVNRLDQQSITFKRHWKKIKHYDDAAQLVDNTANQLWINAKIKIKQLKNHDDRSLYWQRLKISHIIRNNTSQINLTDTEKEALLSKLEIGSRGMSDLEYKKNTTKQLLLTGFDPFLLDKNINQSNPSGVVALLLDGMIIHHQGITAEINTLLAPVRYQDFDEGFVEKTLAPFYLLNNVNMITTVSMGRKHFDLERFPGKRRSSATPDNLNRYSGGSKLKPIIPKLHNKLLQGPEFVEFSLPVNVMIKAEGQFKIVDNHQVSTLHKTFKPETLKELNNAIAVAGSGGKYLSNEISYRSIRLRNQLQSKIPTGHIHTPRINQYDPKATKAIVEQIIRMLQLALAEI